MLTTERSMPPAALPARTNPEGDRVIGLTCGACLVAAGATQRASACFWSCRARFDRVGLATLHASGRVAFEGSAWTNERRRAVEAFVAAKRGGHA
ncbi:MAG: hypothetical protein JNM74_26165 [Myxococcales bacterium]|nr:hypothetical protein [Myxococcales bacterium]